ncbi:DUF2339 domain-containing protein [Geminisphaera colitermitum]|uniref:DUF2339 domain-containing protein n=1 Tax=Geminisphaera colitermitum TaxID=1148786 RepID=UPI0005BA5333|nr:DUF2339 domain-containing protein [Geminisphaera colitermitum]
MNLRYDIDLLKKRLSYLEENMAEVKQRIARLEASCETEQERPNLTAQIPNVRPPVVVTEFPVVEPPPLPVQAAVVAADGSGAGVPPALFQTAGETPAPPSIPKAGGTPAPLQTDEPPAWKPWLQKIHLWPPSAAYAGDAEGAGGRAGESNTEVRLAAWWTTRIGMALLVIGIVFLGVYFSVNANPVVKFTELLAVSVGVAAGGLWLERKIPKFGAVVFGGGLALLYFCAFAAHAIPAMRVIENPVAATGWQLAAALLMGGAALWRRSPVIATMATALAVASAVFAHTRGMPGFALVTVALLAVGGVVFHRWKRWEGPSVVAMPGAYAVYALVWHGSWLRELRMTGEVAAVAAGAWPWVFLTGMLLLHFARDWRGTRSEGSEFGYGERFFQGLNSSLALTLGFATAVSLQREHLAVFYFSAAVVMGALVVLRQWRMPGDVVAAVFAAKATGVFALGLIEVGEGRMMAIQLLVQAGVMLFIARRMRSRFLVAWTGLIALAAYGYFIWHVFEGIAVASFPAAVAVLFVTGFSLLAAGLGRRCGAWREVDEIGRLLEFIGATLAVVAAVTAVMHASPRGWEPAALMVFAGAGVLAARVFRTPGPVVMGGVLTLAAHGFLCADAWAGGGGGDGHRLVVNALVVLAPTIAAGIMLACRTQGWLARIAPGLWALAIFSGAQVLFEVCGARVSIVVMAGLAFALAVAAPWASARWRLTSLATWAALLGVVCWLAAGRLFPWNATGWTAGAAVLLWLTPVVLRLTALPRHRAAREAAPLAAAQEWLQAGCALVVTLCAAWAIAWSIAIHGHVGVWPLCTLAYGAVALAVAFLAWRPGVIPALAASWLAWLAALFPIVFHKQRTAESVTLFEYISFCIMTLIVWTPAWWSTRLSFPSKRWLALIGPVQAGLGVVAAWFLATRFFEGTGTHVVFIFAILFIAQVLRQWRLTAARPAMLVLGAGAWWHALTRVAAGWVQGMSPESGMVVLLAVLVAALPWLAGEGPKPLSFVVKNRLRWLAGAAGLSLVFFAAWKQHDTFAPYVTVIWGLAAISLFMCGLLARVRPYRLLGLAGLALCVPRMFFVDLHSALYRIAAFVVLGLVLLWVGFSYHKFRHLIVEERPENKTGNGTDKTESE